MSPTHFVSNVRHQHRCNHCSRTIRYPEKSLLIVPKLPHITVLSLGFSQMFVPATIRLLFDFNGKSKVKETGENKTSEENAGEKIRQEEVRKEKKSRTCSKICSKTCYGILNGVTRLVVFIMFLIHFAAIGYNLYVRGLDWHWIVLLYLYIIWSSFKYAANYLRVENPIISPKKNFETDCMRSWIASVFQIISKINFYHNILILLNRIECYFDTQTVTIRPFNSLSRPVGIVGIIVTFLRSRCQIVIFVAIMSSMATKSAKNLEFYYYNGRYFIVSSAKVFVKSKFWINWSALHA